MPEPTQKDIRTAAKRLAPFIHRTPVLTSQTLDRICEAEIAFKCENFQKTGSFKIRGAANAVFSLNDKEAMRGVATHSSGNHAAALALAARWRNIKAYVVMPKDAPSVKKQAVADYGADIIGCEPTLAAREGKLTEVLRETGAVFIPPYNDYRMISGQGTAALEFCEQCHSLDVILCPVGGGGLLSGTALAVAAVSPDTRVLAAEPENADDAYRSFYANRLMPAVQSRTIADGLRTALGTLTFPIIKNHVDAIVTVSEEDIIEAMRLLWERMKIVVEPSAAVPLGALLKKPAELTGKRVGIILSGGNVDLDKLPWLNSL